MATLTRVDSLNDLTEVIEREYAASLFVTPGVGAVRVELYVDAPDRRIGWPRTYLVSARFYDATKRLGPWLPVGWTDGPL